MKFKILSLVLAVSGIATAAPLYTVTIKLNPPQGDGNIYLINANGKNSDSCGSMGKVGPTLTCKLPAGKYKLSVFAEERSFDGPQNQIVVVSKNLTLSVPIKVKTVAPLTRAAAQAFSTFLIKTNGTLDDCNEYTVSPDKLCADVRMDIELMKKWVGLVPTLNQISPWETFGDDAISANFLIGGQKQHMLIGNTNKESKFLWFKVGWF